MMTLEEKRKKNTEYARLWRSKPENRKKKRAADKRYREKNYAKCKASWDKWRKEGELKGKGMVVTGKIAGRTTYWVEGWQKLYEQKARMRELFEIKNFR